MVAKLFCYSVITNNFRFLEDLPFASLVSYSWRWSSPIAENGAFVLLTVKSPLDLNS